MADQIRRVTGNPSVRRRTADAILQAKIARLPQQLANQQRREQIARDTEFQNQQIRLQKDSVKQRKREQEAAMGLEAAKFGINLSDFNSNASNVKDATKTTVTGGTESSSLLEGFTSSLPGAVGSGLVGFGAGKMAGGKSKGKKTLLGAGAGFLSSLLSNKPGFGDNFGGAILGGIGGYFS